jgi:hypothetical protein
VELLPLDEKFDNPETVDMHHELHDIYRVILVLSLSYPKFGSFIQYLLPTPLSLYLYGNPTISEVIRKKRDHHKIKRIGC